MKEAIRRILPTAGIILLLAVLMAGVLLWMGRMEIISLPDFVLRIFNRDGGEGHTDPPEDDGRIYEALESRESGGAVIVEPGIAPEDALEMLRSADSPSGLYIENTVTLYANGAERVTTNKISLDAEKYRVENDSGISVICDGGRISYSDSGGSRKFGTDRRSACDFASMPDMGAVMDMLSTKTVAAELLRDSGENILYVELEIPSLSQTEKYYVSLDYGVVVRAESYSGDKLVYSLTTQLIRTEEFGGSVFSLQ